MSEQTHYQVLGVRPEASPSVIQAAYQRLVRQHQTELALTRRHAGLDVMLEADAKLERIEEAYIVLRDPVRRQQYDEKLLARHASVESVALAHRAQQYLAESGAWLSRQRYEENEVIFQIGWAADFSAVRKALEERIPAHNRHFDAEKREWRVAVEHSSVLADLFDNYEAPDRPPPPRLPLPIYKPPSITPTRHRVREVWEGWPFLIITGLAVAIVLTLLFPPVNERMVAVQATATAAALFELAQQAPPGSFPTPTPEPTQAVFLSVSPRHPSVHLRSGPGTDYPSLGFLNAGEAYWAVGRTPDDAWIVVATAEQIGWSAEWTLSIDGDLTALAIYAADAELPSPLPTPTPHPSPDP